VDVKVTGLVIVIMPPPTVVDPHLDLVHLEEDTPDHPEGAIGLGLAPSPVQDRVQNHLGVLTKPVIILDLRQDRLLVHQKNVLDVIHVLLVLLLVRLESHVRYQIL